MEDLKEIFAQMMKFQMESQQKNEEKLFQLHKENKERILQNEEKQQRFFLELQKQQEAHFKCLSNNQPTDSTTIFIKMQCGTHSKHFPMHQMRIRPLRHITEDMKISILPTVPIGLIQKKIQLLLRKLGTVEHNKFIDYILSKKTCELGFLETVKLLSELFSSKTPLFHKRWKCLNLTKRDCDDYLGFASVVNKN